MDIKRISAKYNELFSSKPLLIRSPGRINFIGEHTDYNEGFVLPAAINKTIVFAMGKNNKNTIRLFSVDMDEYFETPVNKIKITKNLWANYLIGVLAQVQKAKKKARGIDCVFGGNIPIGAGLSSSAAVECGFAFGVNELYDLQFEKLDLVKMAQKAEHEYARVNCGIMDQFTSIFGKKDQVLQLDCRSFDHEFFPLNLRDHTVILCDTRVKHSLADTAYNQRREECELGVTLMQQYEPQVKSLRDISIEMLFKYQKKLDPVIFRRCRYVIEENNRVIESGLALQSQNLELFGKLMYRSHLGLKNEYEVSCEELDLLVDIARKSGCVTGSRMMGGGFGGCTINLVDKQNAEKFKDLVLSEYSKQIQQEPVFYDVDLIDGVSIIEES